MEFKTEVFQKLRLVCRTWRDVSLPIWRKNAWLDISKEKRRTAYIAQLESNSNRMTHHPFQKFVIDSWNHPHIGKRNFWNIVGKKMKHLRILESTFHSKECLREILFRNTPNLGYLELRGNTFKGRRPKRQSNRLDPDRPHHIKPHLAQNNLKHLHLEMIDIHAGDVTDVGVPAQDFPLTWMELVSHFPKIETFVAPGWGTDGDKELAELLQSVEILRREYGHEYWALTDLNITMLLECIGTFCPELPASLDRLHFPLKALSLEIGDDIGEEEFWKILQHYADSLEKLVVWMEGLTGSISLSNFPSGVQLEKLTYLEVQGPNFITDLTFLKQMPNLKYFIHDTGYLQEAPLNVLANLDQLDGFRHENMRHLCIRSGTSQAVYRDNLHGSQSYRGLFTPNEIAAIKSLMPNLTDLRLGLDNEGFQFICQDWNTLSDLTIRPFLVDEIGFLGIQEGCKFRLPNFTNMKNLKTFSTGEYTSGFQLEFPLTNDCIVDGLLALNNLQTVEFRISSEVGITVISQLETRFPSCDEEGFYHDDLMEDLLNTIKTRRESRQDSEHTCCDFLGGLGKPT